MGAFGEVACQRDRPSASRLKLRSSPRPLGVDRRRALPVSFEPAIDVQEATFEEDEVLGWV